MDTVAAEHLGLNGYHRPTSNTLVELAGRGVRFDSARSTCPWTLPSHASMFTGRWFHETSAGWLTPLDETHPTLAEFLGDHGYATSAFTANYTYCARDSGLARGFTHFEDHYFPELTCFKMSAVVNRTLEAIQADRRLPGRNARVRGVSALFQAPVAAHGYESQGCGGRQSPVPRLAVDASAGSASGRFCFLNYYDAHFPVSAHARADAPLWGRGH